MSNSIFERLKRQASSFDAAETITRDDIARGDITIRKQTLSSTALTQVGDLFEFNLSSPNADRANDEIVQEGIQCDEFILNPVCLWAHRSDEPPIGTWHDLRIVNGCLRGFLRLAAEGTSSRIDEIIRLVRAKILRAVSIGFFPIQVEPIKSTGGTRYVKSRLVEVSLCAVPMNPDALAVAKSLGVHDDIISQAFIGHPASDDQSLDDGDDEVLGMLADEIGQAMGTLERTTRDELFRQNEFMVRRLAELERLQGEDSRFTRGALDRLKNDFIDLLKRHSLDMEQDSLHGSVNHMGRKRRDPLQ
jgi:HK97 family phage prohead protease